MSQLIFLTTAMKATVAVAATFSNPRTLASNSALQPKILHTWSKSNSSKTNNNLKRKLIRSATRWKVIQARFISPLQLDSAQNWTKMPRVNNLQIKKTIAPHLQEILKYVSQAKLQSRKTKTQASKTNSLVKQKLNTTISQSSLHPA